MNEIRILTVQIENVVIELTNPQTLSLSNVDEADGQPVAVNFDSLAKVMKLFAKERK